MPATSKAARLKASGKAYRCKSVQTLSVSLWMSFGQRCLTSQMMVSTCMHKKQSKHVCLHKAWLTVSCSCLGWLIQYVLPIPFKRCKIENVQALRPAGRHCCCLKLALPTSPVHELQTMSQLFRKACSACWKLEAGHDTGGRNMHHLIASLSGRCYPWQSQEQYYLLLNIHRNKRALFLCWCCRLVSLTGQHPCVYPPCSCQAVYLSFVLDLGGSLSAL